MRNDIETREIADDELDAVSGGIALGGGLLGGVTGDVQHVLGTVTSSRPSTARWPSPARSRASSASARVSPVSDRSGPA
ncbi:hypothetical protein [Streptomyces cirratus]|uniref:hypothetical protein n=1 Tax=Streptomyces cirratus TaxID=68187 RepID=UPI00361BD05F